MSCMYYKHVMFILYIPCCVLCDHICISVSHISQISMPSVHGQVFLARRSFLVSLMSSRFLVYQTQIFHGIHIFHQAFISKVLDNL